MATEEGHLTPVGIVFAESFAPFQAARSKWDLVRFASSWSFDVGQIAKLASACGSLDSLLVVMPQEKKFVVAGIATPHSRGFMDLDHLVRVLILKPGVISVRRDEWEIVRYERGRLLPRPPPLIGGSRHHRTQLDTIGREVFKEEPERLTIDVGDFLLRIVKGMVRLGHGGLLAVLGPEDSPELVLQGSKQLAEPLRFGAELLEMYEAQLIDEQNTIRRFSTVPPVFSVADDQRPGEIWPLDIRGTRHRAAAIFAEQHPQGLAFIVSQDGDAAILQQLESKVVHWPLSG